MAERNLSKVVRWLRLVLLVGLIAGPIALIALWLALHYIPDWYQPVDPTSVEARNARNELINVTDDISRQIVRAEPFELVLTDRTVNQWLTVIPQPAPADGRDGLASIRAPAVRFEPGRIRIGGEYSSAHWTTIVNVCVAIGVTKDGSQIVLRLKEVRGGLLPVPRSLIREMLLSLVQRARPTNGAAPDLPEDVARVLETINSADALSDGVAVANRFIWPNGKRPYRIESIRFEDGVVRISIEPL